MRPIHIESPDSLNGWLRNQPEYWAQMLATRTALRVMPLIGQASDEWLLNYALSSFRAVALLWAAHSAPAYEMGGAIMLAATAAEDSYSADTANSAANSAADAIARAASTEQHFSNAGYAAYAAYNANAAYMGTITKSAIWERVTEDCNWLTLHGSESRMLSAEPLWPSDPPIESRLQWFRLSQNLLSVDNNYDLWIDWYERRIRGETAAFDIPGDKGRVEDKKILRRLAEATDEDFWGKGHEYVNATLKGWLDEARERAAGNLPPIFAEASGSFEITGSATAEVLDAIKLDPQDVRSPQFGSDRTGRIAIKPDAGTDQLRSDAQSLSRHARALQMAQMLGEALRNHNNAGYMTEMASDYVMAMESELDGPDPSGLVFAGDQLREAIAKHRAAGVNDDLQPLPPSADRDASAFLAAHNMYVGSDPFLDDLDRTTRGPDAPLPSANPDEIMGVVTAARQADIVAEPTYDYMAAASNAAPTVYDPTDRHSRFAAGLAQNFARYGVEFLWAYPTETAWAGIAAAGVGAMMTVGIVATGAGAIAGVGIAYHMARNIVANEAVYRKLLATSPAGEDNFNRLIRFLKSTAIKSLKDD